MTATLAVLACLPYMILYPCNLILYNVCSWNNIAENFMFSWVFSCSKSWGRCHLILHHRGVATHQVLPSTPVDLCVHSLHLLLRQVNLSRNVCGKVQTFDKKRCVSHQWSNVPYLRQNRSTNEGRACDTFRTVLLCSFATGNDWKCLLIQF